MAAALVAVAVLLGLPATAAATVPVEEHLLVRWTPQAGPAERSAARERVRALAGVPDAEVVRVTPRVDALALPGVDVAALVAEVVRDPAVELAQPDRVVHAAAGSLRQPDDAQPEDPPWRTDDPLLPQQWGLWNRGRPVGPLAASEPALAGVDARVLSAWEVTVGRPEVTVAVIDTAVVADHPDLRGAVVLAVDLVGAGVAGRDHGTGVASVIAARADDGVGMAGVAPEVGVVSIAVFRGEGISPGTSTIAAVLAGFNAAATAGADVINASWVTTVDDPLLRAAIADTGVPVVAASGNEGRALTPVSRVYPAVYDLDNLITVTAVAADGRVPRYANVGPAVVDVGAPGDLILGATADGGHTWFTGTSFAVPHVAGALALARSVAPDAAAAELVDAVRWTSRVEPALAGRTVTGGMLDVAALVRGVQQPVCAASRGTTLAFTDLAVAGPVVDAVACTVAAGVLRGRTATRFAPEPELTRGQAATALAAVVTRARPDLPAPTHAGFGDVAPGDVHASGIDLLAGLGVVAGRSDGRFRPELPVTRGQFAALMVRTYELLVGESPPPSRAWFADVVASVHEQEVHRARDLGLVTGVDRLQFLPLEAVRRDQAAVMLAALLDAEAREGER